MNQNFTGIQIRSNVRVINYNIIFVIINIIIKRICKQSFIVIPNIAGIDIDIYRINKRNSTTRLKTTTRVFIRIKHIVVVNNGGFIEEIQKVVYFRIIINLIVIIINSYYNTTNNSCTSAVILS